MTDFKPRIRAATIDDAAAIAYVQLTSQAALQGISWNAIRADARPILLNEKKIQWERAFMSQRRSGEYIVVAEDDNEQVIGFASGQKVFGQPDEGELVNLFVAPEAQGRGVARRLVSAVTQWLQEQGMQSLIVHSDSSARTYYEQTLRGTYLGEEQGIDEKKGLYRWDDLSQLIFPPDA